MFLVENAVFRYQGVVALDGVSLEIAEGKRSVLLGANGSGKSTLLRILDGLCYPESGRITFRGDTIDQASLERDEFAQAFRRRVGLVFQNPDVQLFNPTVLDEIAFGPLQMRWPKDDILKRVEATMATMEITHLKDRPPHRLSGGEKKRVAIASVLVLDPEVLLLDEPTAALDPRSQSQIIDLLIGWGGGRKTVITATHDLGLVEDIADDCFLLQQGRLVAHAAPSVILKDEALLRAANLIHEHRHAHPSLGLTAGEHTHPHAHRT
ncbi:MAG TPA: ABC transporter ATP-binding protein [Bryobacteraceae bacterium]|nr:ABC transporter ATP-binding protein [Bryobacteraceae bacterium]